MAISLQTVTIHAIADRPTRRTLFTTMSQPQPRPGIGFLLSQLGGQSSKRWTERLDQLGLEPREVMVFRFVAMAEGRSQTEIARAIGLPASRIVALVDRLEGGVEAIRAAGLPLIAICSRRDFIPD